MKEQAGKIIDFVRETEQCQGVPSRSKSIMRMAQGYQFFAWRSILTPIQRSVGVSAIKDSIYKEIEFRKETIMNEVIKAGEVFKLAELLPYQEGKIVNMDLAHNDKMKFVVMSFDAGTGLSEHAAPGEALVMALDGEAVIGYEGQEQVIHAGETFKFDKFGKHSVSATKQFKMATVIGS